MTLKQVLREKYPTKSEKEIALEQETIGTTFIEEWQWKSIILKMYEIQDAQYLCQKMYGLLQHKVDLKENQSFNSLVTQKY